jgi:hypothetical protein
MCVWSSAVAIPKRVIDSIGGFPAGVKLGGDRETWLRIAVDHNVAFCNRELATWFLNASNRVSSIYERQIIHPVVSTGQKLLCRTDLSYSMHRELHRYLIRTQIFTAKQLIRIGQPVNARRVLLQCDRPSICLLRWLFCFIGTFFPGRLFAFLYSAFCRLRNQCRNTANIIFANIPSCPPHE